MAEPDNFLRLLQSFHLERMTASERGYFLDALSDAERHIVVARLGLGVPPLTLGQIVSHQGLSLSRLVAMEMRCVRRLALQDHLRQSGTASV